MSDKLGGGGMLGGVRKVKAQGYLTFTITL